MVQALGQGFLLWTRRESHAIFLREDCFESA